MKSLMNRKQKLYSENFSDIFEDKFKIPGNKLKDN